MARTRTLASVIRQLWRLKKSRLPSSEFFRRWAKARTALYSIPEYQLFLQEIRSRASLKCEICFKKGRHVHHLTRVYDNPDLCVDTDNGQFLCVSCHRKEHE